MTPSPPSFGTRAIPAGLDAMARKRVLLIDDDASVARALGVALRRVGGFETRVESNGRLALSAAREFRPDVILLDLMMPDVDGAEVAASLAADPDLRAVPIAFLSGLITEGEGQRSDAGGRRFIAKPISVRELIEAVNELLAQGALSSPRVLG